MLQLANGDSYIYQIYNVLLLLHVITYNLQNLDYTIGQLVAVKTIAGSEENPAIGYGLTRIELNKLLSANHPNVLRFIGITVIPPAIVIEYAPLGSLLSVAKQYREKGNPICPASITMILYQVHLCTYCC